MSKLNELRKLAGLPVISEAKKDPEAIKGLDGPFSTNKGRKLYFDKKENRFYDRGSDHYVDLDDGEEDPRAKAIEKASRADESVKIEEAKNNTPEVKVMSYDDLKSALDLSFYNSLSSLYSDSATDRSFNYYKVPVDVKKAVTDRIKELNDLIEIEDEKGYNDHSLKAQAIECIEQIMQNLSAGDAEGYKQAVIYMDTLMSPLLDLLPAQLIKFLRLGLTFGVPSEEK